MQCSEEGSTAWKWRQANPGAAMPDFSAKNLPGKKPGHLPKQDNWYDCGLFCLAYVHFFTFEPPAHIDRDHLQCLGGAPPLQLAHALQDISRNYNAFLWSSNVAILTQSAPLRS